MTVHEQGGADFEYIGKRKSKSAFKAAIKDSPANVYLFSTTAVPGAEKWSGTADKLPDGMEFNVVGPDPYTRRDWYATVTKTARGKLKVI